jgi:hypothetical protein
MYRDLLDNFVIRDNQRAEFVLQRLIELDLVTSDHSFYYLELDELNAHAVNYVDLRANRLTDPIRELVRLIVG